jgi:hypothetical protein
MWFSSVLPTRVFEFCGKTENYVHTYMNQNGLCIIKTMFHEPLEGARITESNFPEKTYFRTH